MSSCGYCQIDGANGFELSPDHGGHMWVDNYGKYAVLCASPEDDGEDPMEAVIYYCPMCGRSLGKHRLRIEQVLKERGLSKAKAARMADVNQSCMSRIVNGKEPAWPKRGQRIADAIGWEGDWRELFEEVCDD